MKKFSALLANSRFYILAASLLLSIFIAAYLRTRVPSDQLYYIRLEQLFGFISIGFLYVAVVLTPASKLIGKRPWLQKLLFARRAVGVSAAYFALLHTSIIMTQQIGGWGGLSLLPMRFKVSFVLGTLALIILSLMAITSFDKAIKIMKFKNWKRLHRLVYVAGLVVIVHVWLIGTHIENASVKLSATILLAVLFALECKRIAKAMTARYKLGRSDNLMIFIVLLAVMLSALFSLPTLTKNYHSEHHDHATADSRIS